MFLSAFYHPWKLKRQFENLFRNLGDVSDGFPKQIPLDELQGRKEYDANMLEENLMFGSPETVIEKLKRYEKLGVDEYIYYASMGLDMEAQKKSMELFCSCLLYTSPSPRDLSTSRMPSSA